MPPRGFRRHNKRIARRTLRHFAAVTAISFILIGGIALLGRAEMRLAGAVVPVENDSLSSLFLGDPAPEVHLLSEDSSRRIYLLIREGQRYLVHVVHRKRGVDDWQGEWVIERFERAHGE
jgi:hypothetical protein